MIRRHHRMVKALATRVPAPDRCHLLGRAGSVKAVFACTFTRQSTGAVALRSQTDLTGSAGLGQSRQREQGRRALHDETCCMSSGPVSCFSRQPTGAGPAVAGAPAGA